MAINVDRAFDVNANGIGYRDDDGNVLFYVVTGTGDPSGSPAPVNTWYFRQDGQLIYYKFGSGNNDWRQIRAQDIDFNNTVAQIQNNPENVQEAITELAGSLESKRFQYVHYQFIGQMNFDQYLYAHTHATNDFNRRSGDTSNGYRFGNSAPPLVAFTGTVINATAGITGIAQSTGSPAANMELLFELWSVGFNGEGTKIGDIIFNIVSANYTIGNFWNSSILTEFQERQSQNVSVTDGTLLGLKFIRQTGNDKVVAVTNTTIVLEIEN